MFKNLRVNYNQSNARFIVKFKDGDHTRQIGGRAVMKYPDEPYVYNVMFTPNPDGHNANLLRISWTVSNPTISTTSVDLIVDGIVAANNLNINGSKNQYVDFDITSTQYPEGLVSVQINYSDGSIHMSNIYIDYTPEPIDYDLDLFESTFKSFSDNVTFTFTNIDSNTDIPFGFVGDAFYSNVDTNAILSSVDSSMIINPITYGTSGEFTLNDGTNITQHLFNHTNINVYANLDSLYFDKHATSSMTLSKTRLAPNIVDVSLNGTSNIDVNYAHIVDSNIYAMAFTSSIESSMFITHMTNVITSDPSNITFDQVVASQSPTNTITLQNVSYYNDFENYNLSTGNIAVLMIDNNNNNTLFVKEL